MSKKDKAISVTFVNAQNKVFDFSNIILRDDDGNSMYSDDYVKYTLSKLFNGAELLRKQSLNSDKPKDSWNKTNEVVNELKDQIFEKTIELDFLKARLNAIENTKSYITRVNSCSSFIDWLG